MNKEQFLRGAISNLERKNDELKLQLAKALSEKSNVETQPQMIEGEQLKPTYEQLEELYNAQCECTDEWAEKLSKEEAEKAELLIDLESLRAKVASADVLVGALREAKLALLSGVLTYESVRIIEKAIAKYNKLIGVKHD